MIPGRSASLLAALALLASAPALAGAPRDEPCGGFQLVDGRVELTRTLKPADARSAATDACLAAVARALTARPNVRSVLVAARVDGGEKVRREAAGAAAYVTSRLIAHGIPVERISSVAPRTLPREPDSIRITFIERRELRPVAQLFAAAGQVRAGHSQSSLLNATPGAVLASHQLIETGEGSVATVHLIDGSRLRVTPDSLMRFGDISASGGRRDVRFELLRGEAHVRASRRDGPLRVTTPNAEIDVQATRFRVAITDDGRTRIETLDGTVSFAGLRGQVFVTRGEGSSIDPSGYPDEPRSLLLPPRVLEPVLGLREEGDLLVWAEVPNAVRYHVEFARNAQFDDAYWDVTVQRDRMLVGAAHTPGKWFWRVTAIDPADFAGATSKTFAFEVLAPTR